MSDFVQTIRRKTRWLLGTPLHPQWLYGRRTAAAPWIAGRARGRVIDIGCGDRWVEPFLSSSCAYLALDFPPTGKLMYRAHPHVFASASALPLPDQSVDTVLLIEVAEHLAQPASAFAEIARVLRPGGRLLMSVPFLYPIHDAPHDYQRWTVHGLVRSLEASGLTVGLAQHTHGSAESAGLLLNLSLAGISVEALRNRRLSALLVPFLLAAIPLVNLASWMLARLLPDWPALTAGYRIEAHKPGT
jgi:SAM-dependent methyltransferase